MVVDAVVPTTKADIPHFPGDTHVSQNDRPVVLIADKLAQSTVDALGDGVEVRWVDGPNRPCPTQV